MHPDHCNSVPEVFFGGTKNNNWMITGFSVHFKHIKVYVYLCAVEFQSFLIFAGSYFCYDTPASLQNQVKEDMDVNTMQFTSLYSLYSWPNVVLCFVGGFLIDR